MKYLPESGSSLIIVSMIAVMRSPEKHYRFTCNLKFFLYRKLTFEWLVFTVYMKKKKKQTKNLCSKNKHKTHQQIEPLQFFFSLYWRPPQFPQLFNNSDFDLIHLNIYTIRISVLPKINRIYLPKTLRIFHLKCVFFFSSMRMQGKEYGNL